MNKTRCVGNSLHCCNPSLRAVSTGKKIVMLALGFSRKEDTCSSVIQAAASFASRSEKITSFSRVDEFVHRETCGDRVR